MVVVLVVVEGGKIAEERDEEGEEGGGKKEGDVGESWPVRRCARLRLIGARLCQTDGCQAPPTLSQQRLKGSRCHDGLPAPALS